jgi:hypothetical protein
MNSETLLPEGINTLRPQEIDSNDFICGYQLARVASIDVLESISGRSTHSLRMGYIAYVALSTNNFPDIDCIKAAEFAEGLGLGESLKK